jgi:hypothetical protein
LKTGLFGREIDLKEILWEKMNKDIQMNGASPMKFHIAVVLVRAKKNFLSDRKNKNFV